MIKIYSVQSLNLYNAEEEAIRAEISSLNRDKHRFIMAEAVTYVEANESIFTKECDKLSGIETMEGKIDYISTKANKLFSNLDWKDIYTSAKAKEEYSTILESIKIKNAELRTLIGENEEVRTLNFEPNTKNEISIFESTLTRTLGCGMELNMCIYLVVQVMLELRSLYGLEKTLLVMRRYMESYLLD